MATTGSKAPLKLSRSWELRRQAIHQPESIRLLKPMAGDKLYRAGIATFRDVWVDVSIEVALVELGLTEPIEQLNLLAHNAIFRDLLTRETVTIISAPVEWQKALRLGLPRKLRVTDIGVTIDDARKVLVVGAKFPLKHMLEFGDRFERLLLKAIVEVIEPEIRRAQTPSKRKRAKSRTITGLLRSWAGLEIDNIRDPKGIIRTEGDSVWCRLSRAWEKDMGVAEIEIARRMRDSSGVIQRVLVRRGKWPMSEQRQRTLLRGFPMIIGRIEMTISAVSMGEPGMLPLGRGE